MRHPLVTGAALPWPPEAALSWAKQGDTVPMINAMDTATSHPDDLVRIPLTRRTAQHPSRFLNDPLECPSYGRKSPVIANGWNVVCGNCALLPQLSRFCQGIPMLLACQPLE